MPSEAPISKAEFAHICGVHPSRVSHWIKERKIGPEAIVGQGRTAKLLPGLAQKHLRTRLDAGQRFGNGLDTQLNWPSPRPALAPSPEPASASLTSSAGAALQVLAAVPAMIAYDALEAGMELQLVFNICRGMALNIGFDLQLEDPAGLIVPVDWAVIGPLYGHEVDLEALERGFARYRAANLRRSEGASNQ